MIFYRFHEAAGSLVAITRDITGANLPKSPSGWKADGQTEVTQGGRPRWGVEPDVIIATIERDGLFLRPGSPLAGE